MLRKTYFKIIGREIRESFGRFAAILAITALGAGFLIGVMSATPAMKYSVDRYYDENNMADVFIKSETGFSEEEINLLSSLPGTEHLTPAFVTDTVVTTDTNETLTARITGLDLAENNRPDFVGRLTLTEGRMPEKAGECLVLHPDENRTFLYAGTVLTVSEENENRDFIYAAAGYTVVGTAVSPFYFSAESERSTAGSGRIDAVIYTPEESFALPAYTDVYLTAKGAAELDSFGEAYGDRIKEYKEEIGSSGLDPEGRYVLDRGANVSFVSYKMNVRKVSDVARVFPVFFFFVAALVTLTTMTRMVGEERTQIGTLRALGYGRGAVMFKYLAYCTLASAAGSLAGFAAGAGLLPAVINNAYASVYRLPPFLPKVDIAFALSVCALQIAGTAAVTYFACRHVLKEKPALLMLPKAPKAGKRIFLERVKPLWSRLSFSYKATARNIFRYKKHLLMTVFGVAGCTALILTGFGLKDSMSSIAGTQFDRIFLYDMKIELADPEVRKDPEGLLTGKSTMPVYSLPATLKTGRDEIEAVVMVPADRTAFGDFIFLGDRITGEPVPLPDRGTVLTEKLASDLGVAAGGMFTLESEDGAARFRVTAVTENYAGSFVYIDKELYGAVYGEKAENILLVKSGVADGADMDRVTGELLASGTAAGVEFTAQAKRSYDNLLSSLNYIILVLIAAAGALAVVVLYNLTNINIGERMKELATLRVLGYHHGEVASYILREITILTVMGIFAGLGLGVLLLRFIIVSAESTDMMFGREIAPLSFLLSAAATMAFSLSVDLLMAKKLRKIRMTESMKAID